MEGHQIVGIALVFAGVMDAVMVPLMRKRITDERQRGIVTMALLSGAFMMCGVGAMILAGLISF